MTSIQAALNHLPEGQSIWCGAEDTRVLGRFLRNVAKLNQDQSNFRLLGPDETVSNLLGAIFELPAANGMREVAGDEFLAPWSSPWSIPFGRPRRRFTRYWESTGEFRR